MIIHNTPWESYSVNGIDVHVKREDLSCPDPGPGFSKVRGVTLHLQKMIYNAVLRADVPVTIGVMDTRHSKAGWGVAQICNELGLRCVDFYPVLKGEGDSLRENQQHAKGLGAILYPMKAGMSAVLYHQAKKILRENWENSYMLPNGLKVPESVDSTSEEVAKYTPKSLLKEGSWVVSISSGTIGSAVWQALQDCQSNADMYFHLGYSRSLHQIRQDVYDLTGYDAKAIHMIDQGYEYKDKVDTSWIPFPCNEYYDAKAFLWLCQNVHRLKTPIVFWNIGS